MAQKKGGKVKIKVKQSAKLVRKGTAGVDTTKVRKAPFQPLRDTGASFRIKIKSKGS